MKKNLLCGVVWCGVVWCGVVWCVNNGFRCDPYVFFRVVKGNHLNIIIMLRESGLVQDGMEVPNCDYKTFLKAISLKNDEIIDYCFENSCPMDPVLYLQASLSGDISMFERLESHGCPKIPTILTHCANIAIENEDENIKMLDILFGIDISCITIEVLRKAAFCSSEKAIEWFMKKYREEKEENYWIQKSFNDNYITLIHELRKEQLKTMEILIVWCKYGCRFLI